MINRTTICVALVFGMGTATAQEKLGHANSNYAGTSGMALNPSSMVDSKAWLDINLVGVDAFAWNNYAYFPKSDFHLWSKLTAGETLNPQTILNGREKHGAINLRVDGPSFTLSHGKNAFGFHTAARAFISAEDIMEPSARFISEGLSFDEQEGIRYDQQGSGVYGLSWGEIGLSYGRIVYQQGKDMITVGGTAKYLMGIAHASLQFDNFNHTVVNNQDWNIDNFTGRYAFTNPGVAAGHGFAVDLGATYKKMLEDVDNYAPHTPQSDCGTIDYRYKIGVSLLDLGGIRFNNNSILRAFNNTSATWNDYPDADVNSLEDADALIVSQFASDGNVVTSGNRYSAQLPSAVSVQFDYNLGKHFYANATWVQGVRFSKKYSGIRRSVIGIIPRYETKWFEASLPLSLYDYRHPRMGLALRFYNITIGSDNLLPLIAPVDIRSVNIYASLKITLFKNPACTSGKRSYGNKAKKSKSGKRKKGSAVDCPAFN